MAAGASRPDKRSVTTSLRPHACVRRSAASAARLTRGLREALPGSRALDDGRGRWTFWRAFSGATTASSSTLLTSTTGWGLGRLLGRRGRRWLPFAAAHARAAEWRRGRGSVAAGRRCGCNAIRQVILSTISGPVLVSHLDAREIRSARSPSPASSQQKQCHCHSGGDQCEACHSATSLRAVSEIIRRRSLLDKAWARARARTDHDKNALAWPPGCQRLGLVLPAGCSVDGAFGLAQDFRPLSKVERSKYVPQARSQAAR